MLHDSTLSLRLWGHPRLMRFARVRLRVGSVRLRLFWVALMGGVLTGMADHNDEHKTDVSGMHPAKMSFFGILVPISKVAAHTN